MHKTDTKIMTIGGHIRELKSRLIVSLVVFTVFFVVFYLNADSILRVILETGRDAGYNFAYIAPYEMLLEALKCAAVFSLFCSAPIILYELFTFISPAIERQRVRRGLVFCIIIACALFVLGTLFCLQMLFPFVFNYLQNYSMQFKVMGYVSVERYVSLYLSLTAIMGIIFEVPVITGFLGRIGVLSCGMMIHGFRPMMVVILVVSAIITPPDVVSMLLIAIPIIAIYCISIVVCKFFEPK